MTDRAAFLASLRESPDDPTGWLVFADWLDEHADPAASRARWYGGEVLPRVLAVPPDAGPSDVSGVGMALALMGRHPDAGALLRLFCCRCLRRLWGQLAAAEARRVVEVNELYALRLATEAECRSALLPAEQASRAADASGDESFYAAHTAYSLARCHRALTPLEASEIAYGSVRAASGSDEESPAQAREYGYQRALAEAMNSVKPVAGGN